MLTPGRHTAAAVDENIDPSTDVEYVADGLCAVPAPVNVEIQLVMTDRTLFDGDMEPAVLTGYGPIPAPLARHLARGADRRTKTWVRRLYADPATGTSPAVTPDDDSSPTPRDGS